VAGAQVTLTAYVNNAEAGWQAATTDARGRYSFSVPAAADRVYVATVAYKDGAYASVPIAFRAAEREKTAPIRVYEPTTDAGVLRVNVHHIIVDVGAGMVQVAELLVFTNPTDRTYIGSTVRADGKRDTLRFSLPPGAGNLEYLEGLAPGRATTGGNAIVDTADVKPGIREIAYSYTLPSARGALGIVRRLDYPTDRVEVFGKAGVNLDVASLARQNPVTTEQGNYVRFSGGPLRAQQDLAIQLTALPGAGSAARWLIVAGIAILVAGALAYPLLRRNARRADALPTREELLAAAAALDDAYEAGRVPRSQYETRRGRYKTMLVQSMRSTDPDE
jgi:hypothetical protein